MPNNENAPVVADESALKSEIDYSIFAAPATDDDNVDSLPDDEPVLDVGEPAYTEQFLSDAAKAFDPGKYRSSKMLPAKAEAHAVRVICDDLRRRANPHEVPLEQAADAIRLILTFIAFRLGETNKDGDVKKRAFQVNPCSEATCAALILAHEHIVAVYPDDGAGHPLDADDNKGVLMRYVHDGYHEGIHVRATDGWFHALVNECRDHQATQRFSEAVARNVAKTVKSDTAYRHLHVIENSDPNIIAFANGLYDVKLNVLRPFSADVVRLRKMPVVWSDDPAECPFTRKDGVTYATPVDLIRSWVGSDELARLLLQLVRVTIGNQKMDQAIILYNPAGANGKSTYIRMVGRLLGKDAVMTTTLSDLCERFGIADLVGTRLISIDDTEGGDYLERASRVKSIISGNDISIERKGENSFSYQPNSIVMLGANNFILSRDKSGGWLRRQLYIPFDAQLRGVADHRVDDWIASPEFLTWLAHYVLTEVDDYDKNNIPQECVDLLREYELENDTVRAFWSAVVEPLPSRDHPDEHGRFCDVVMVGVLWKAYKHWLPLNRPNSKPVQSDTAFIRDVRQILATGESAWRAETNAKNELKTYRVKSYANSAECDHGNGLVLFPVGEVYDKNYGRKVTVWTHALTQAGKSGIGRGFVRVSVASAPVDSDAEASAN